MDKRNLEKTKIVPQMLAAWSATIVLTSCGFHFGWASPSLPILLKDTHVPVSINQSSWVVSFVMIGSVFGPLIAVPIVDRWGRKVSMLLISIPLIISCILIAFAQYYWWYYIARFLSGMSLGASFVIAPMYLGEIAEDRIRGSLGILISVMMNLGFLLPCAIGPWVSRPVLAIFGAMLPIVNISTFIWMPESPHYYMMKDQPDKARESLEWLRGTKNVDKEMEMVRKTVETDLKNPGTLRELFTDKGNRKALIIAFGLYSAQQISGTVAIQSYSTVIFDEVTSAISSSLSVIIIGIVQLIVSVLVVFLSDSAGRRTLLLLSMFLSIIFLIGEAVYFHLQGMEIDVSGISWLPVTSIIGYLCSFTLGLGTIPPALTSEIFPCNVKAYATTICTTYLGLLAVAVSQFYPIIANAYGIHCAFYGFAIGTGLLMVGTYLYLPETKGKSLSEIQDILRGQESCPI